jgi:hypothetical protein
MSTNSAKKNEREEIKLYLAVIKPKNRSEMKIKFI